MSRRAKNEPIIYEEIESDVEEQEIDIENIDIDSYLTDDLLESSDHDTKKKKKGVAAVKKTLTKKKTTKRKAPVKKDSKRKPTQTKTIPLWDKDYMEKLASEYPDPYWKFHADSGYRMVNQINADHPLEIVPCTINDQAPITSMSLSDDGQLLATYSNVGAVRVYDIVQDFRQLRKLRDDTETHIDEFYCGTFVTDKGLIAVGGKLKDRHRWSSEDEDNHILPCPIKIFDLVTAKVVARLEGHSEEILCIKAVQFKGENYFISTSQDGYIYRWKMSEDWTVLIESRKMQDEITCMAFNISFVPNTANKYFMAAVDEHVRLYDFEEAKLLQTFEHLYSSYCDCGKFVKWLDEDLYRQNNTNMDLDESPYAWFISRGAELCDVSDGVSSKPNTCTLHKLIYPTQPNETFRLEEVKRYQNPDYHSNSWLVKITSNGRYILAPTIYGQIFVFNMLTGNVSAILKDHQDGCVKVYTYSDNTVELTVGMKEVQIKKE
ncbi:WD40-repeat-containing domain protein [Choanephora cucurbitarum]|nr:WD40-repeat-containing domain protein [Choanephora cucurbitarum]